MSVIAVDESVLQNCGTIFFCEREEGTAFMLILWLVQLGLSTIT